MFTQFMASYRLRLLLCSLEILLLVIFILSLINLFYKSLNLNFRMFHFADDLLLPMKQK